MDDEQRSSTEEKDVKEPPSKAVKYPIEKSGGTLDLKEEKTYSLGSNLILETSLAAELGDVTVEALVEQQMENNLSPIVRADTDAVNTTGVSMDKGVDHPGAQTEPSIGDNPLGSQANDASSSDSVASDHQHTSAASHTEGDGEGGDQPRSVAPSNRKKQPSPVTIDPHSGADDHYSTQSDVFPGSDAPSDSPDKRPPPPPPTPADVNSPGKGKSAPRLPSFSSLASSLKYNALRQEANDPQRMNWQGDEQVDADQATGQDGRSQSLDNSQASSAKDTTANNSAFTDAMTSPSDMSRGTDHDVTPDQHGSGNESHEKYETFSELDQSGALHHGSSGYCFCVPVRYVVVCLVFVGMLIINAMRTNVGVMVLTILDKESHRFNNQTGDMREIPSVDWDTMMIGFVHAIFYVGYMFTNLPGAYLTTKLPSHTLFGGCILVSCLLNLTLPVAIDMAGYQVTITIRFIQGLSEGLLYPSVYGILRHWSTPPERGRLGSLVFTGAYLGPVIGFPLAGFVTDYLGWEYSYYFNGGLGIVYVFVWAWMSEEKPSHHKMISADELSFIEDLQGSERIDYEGAKIPWSSILTSLPVFSLCVCHFARNWVFILMLTNEPFYLNTFHFTISQNGVFSALPHVIKVSAALVSGYIADFVLSRKLLSTTQTRKMLTCGFGMQALFFGLLTVTADGTTAVVFLTLALGFGGLVVSGWQLNHYDLSTRHASVLVGVTSTVGNMASVAAPLVAGAFTESKSQASWNGVWYITSGITGVACLSFLAFGSGERQQWATPADTAQLVIKPDKRRRQHKARVRPAAKPNLTPTFFSYGQLREEGSADGGHVVPGRVPNYGSQQTTPPVSKIEAGNVATASRKTESS